MVFKQTLHIRCIFYNKCIYFPATQGDRCMSESPVHHLLVANMYLKCHKLAIVGPCELNCKLRLQCTEWYSHIIQLYL